jgi:hypothetical protein
MSGSHLEVARKVKSLYPYSTMSLIGVLRQFSVRPGLIQTGNGEPRKAHFLGKDKATSIQGKQQDPGGKRDDDPNQPAAGPYRALNTITIGEVDNVFQYFQSQLVASPNEAWIAKNYFCSLPLKRRGDGRPSAVFGRVKTCFPSEGHVLNVEEMEMQFPRQDGPPNLLHLFGDDIALQKPVASYCVGVKCFVSEQEKADFSLWENSFASRGFTPVYASDPLLLYEMSAQNQLSFPWLYIVGSEWLALHAESGIRERMRGLLYWNKFVLNYHPRRYSLQYRTLNDELDLNYGFSERVVLTPQSPDQALQKVEEGFATLFTRAMG